MTDAWTPVPWGLPKVRDGRYADVPVETVRRAFEQSGLSLGELARRLGWMKPDTGRLARQFGTRDDINGHGTPTRPRQTMSYKRAYEILEALGIDPVDVDL